MSVSQEPCDMFFKSSAEAPVVTRRKRLTAAAPLFLLKGGIPLLLTSVKPALHEYCIKSDVCLHFIDSPGHGHFKASALV